MTTTQEPRTTEGEAPTPSIYAAAKRGELSTVEALLAEDPSAWSSLADGKSALGAAAAGGHTKVLKALLEAGATDDCVRGWTAACHAAFYGHAEVLEVLSEKLGVAAITAPGAVTMAPLLLASMKNRAACVSLILDADAAALEARDALGRTALMLAATNGDAELIQLLAKRGAPLEATSTDGKTALLWAVCAHKPSAVSALVQLGASPDARTEADPNAPIIPGKDPSRGDGYTELANASGRDPTMKLVVKYLDEYVAHRQSSPGVLMGPMATFPHIAHAQAFVVAEAEAAAAAATAQAAAAATPIAAEAAAPDASDIFGDVPSGAVPSGASSGSSLIEEVNPAEEEAADKHAAEAELSMVHSESKDDLDALD